MRRPLPHVRERGRCCCDDHASAGRTSSAVHLDGKITRDVVLAAAMEIIGRERGVHVYHPSRYGCLSSSAAPAHTGQREANAVGSGWRSAR
jgi:hypothetical protein